jgi:hypothetical protein
MLQFSKSVLVDLTLPGGRAFCGSNDHITKKNLKKALNESALGPFIAAVKRGHSLVVKRYPSKLDMRVRFPLPALSSPESPISEVKNVPSL